MLDKPLKSAGALAHKGVVCLETGYTECCTDGQQKQGCLTLIVSLWLAGLAAKHARALEAANTAGGGASAAVSCCRRQVRALVPLHTK